MNAEAAIEEREERTETEERAQSAKTGWCAELQLDFDFDESLGRTRCRHQHSGPLRVLRALYPEGDAVCHQVLLHPPSGLVGGDALKMQIKVGTHAHAVLTTPGATRFYLTRKLAASQSVQWHLAPNARAEWLPLETLVHSGAKARNAVDITLAPGATMIGWDLVGLGLPASGQPFEAGWLQQRVSVSGAWLDEARIDAGDTRLLQSPLGLAGHTVFGTLWFAAGAPLDAALATALLEGARSVVTQGLIGATQIGPRVVVVRGLAHNAHALLGRFRAIRRAWRMQAWQLSGDEPRVWGSLP